MPVMLYLPNPQSMQQSHMPRGLRGNMLFRFLLCFLSVFIFPFSVFIFYFFVSFFQSQTEGERRRMIFDHEPHASGRETNAFFSALQIIPQIIQIYIKVQK
jgi:hypothetical protein